MLRSERNLQSNKRTKQLKPQFVLRTAFKKQNKKALQNKTKTNKSRDTETDQRRLNRNWRISSKITLDIGCFFTHPMLASFLYGAFVLHILSWLLLFLSREIPSHIPCWLNFYAGSFSYTSLPGFFFILGVSLTHPVLALFFCGEFFLHIPCWLLFVFYLGSFSYTSHACFVFSGEFLLHITWWLYFYVGSFSYTSRAGFLFIRGLSLTHPMLVSFLIWGICLTHFVQLSFFFSFYLGSFSYTSRAGFFFYVGSLSGMQSSLKTTPKEKSWVEDGPEGEKREKVTLKTEKEPYNTLYSK